VFQNDKIKKIYVEYTFLGYAGHLLETPQSLQKPKNSRDLLVYNFRNTFDIDTGIETEPNYKASILLGMLVPDSKYLLKFTVISEPFEEDLIDNNDTAECMEFG
jgi:hypothetical protein